MDEVDLVLLLEEAGRVAMPEAVVEAAAFAAPTVATRLPAAPRRAVLAALLQERCRLRRRRHRHHGGRGRVVHRRLSAVVAYITVVGPRGDLLLLACLHPDSRRQLHPVPAGLTVLPAADLSSDSRRGLAASSATLLA